MQKRNRIGKIWETDTGAGKQPLSSFSCIPPISVKLPTCYHTRRRMAFMVFFGTGSLPLRETVKALVLFLDLYCNFPSVHALCFYLLFFSP